MTLASVAWVWAWADGMPSVGLQAALASTRISAAVAAVGLVIAFSESGWKAGAALSRQEARRNEARHTTCVTDDQNSRVKRRPISMSSSRATVRRPGCFSASGGEDLYRDVLRSRST